MKQFSRLLIGILGIILIQSLWADPFERVSPNHWCFQSIKNLYQLKVVDEKKALDILKNRPVTRYEVAMVISSALQKRWAREDQEQNLVILESLKSLSMEFQEELLLLGVQSGMIEDQIQEIAEKSDSLENSFVEPLPQYGETLLGKGKLDVTGDIRVEMGVRNYQNDKRTIQNDLTGYQQRGRLTTSDDDWENLYHIGMNLFINVDENLTAFTRIQGTGKFGDRQLDENGRPLQTLFEGILRESYQNATGLQNLSGMSLQVEQAYLDVRNFFNLFNLRAGRQNLTLGHNLVHASPVDSVAISKQIDQVWMDMYWFDSRTSIFDEWKGDFQGTYSVYPDQNRAIPLTEINTYRENLPADGFDSLALKMSLDFGGHSSGVYLLSRSYEEYDPYIRMGDPYAVQYTTTNSQGTVDTSDDVKENTSSQIQGTIANNRLINLRAPAADPLWFGLHFDGPVNDQLDYFFEWIHYDPDLPAFLTDEVMTALNPNAQPDYTETTRKNHLDSGQAFLLGVNWEYDDKWNFILQYGQGDEEFVPSTIDYRQKLNGMRGRWNAQATRLFSLPTCSLQGIEDWFFKVEKEFSSRTTGYLSYENVTENDTSLLRNVVPTDGQIWGETANSTLNYPTVGVNREVVYSNPTDYQAIELGIRHLYSTQAEFSLNYYDLRYDQNRQTLYSGANYNQAYNGDYDLNNAYNAGGFRTLKGEVLVRF